MDVVAKKREDEEKQKEDEKKKNDERRKREVRVWTNVDKPF